MVAVPIAAPAARLSRGTLRAARFQHPALALLQRRGISGNEKPLPTKDTPGKGPNQDQLPHVSEEAAQTSKITGQQGPELEQGTPIQEMFKRDKESAKNAPAVLKEQTKASSSGAGGTNGPKGSRPFSTTAARQREVMLEPVPKSDAAMTVKFGFPNLPLPETMHLHNRYPPMVAKMTRLIMRDGKLARAQTNMARILNHLRTAPPPRINPNRPLVPDAPPASQLPLHPVEYLTCAVDSIAPLIRIRSLKGIAGGGQSLPVPTPLSVWQRRRRAFTWILEAVEKKEGRGSGKGLFASKIAEELIAIVEGRSPLWERRVALHKLATSTRANVIKANQKIRR